MKLITKLLAIIIVTALTLSFVPSTAVDQVSANPTGQAWTKYSGNITMQNQRFVTDAWVIKDGATYKMWFTHLMANETEAQILTRIDNMNPDLFISDLLAKDYDGLYTRASGIAAADVVNLLASATTVIGYAESADGITWTLKKNDALADGGGILTGEGAPTVIKTGVNSYEMWYTKAESDLAVGDWTTILSLFGGTQANRKTAVETILNGVRTVIGHATSADGMTWVDTGQVFPAADGNAGDSVGAPCVINDGGTYKMWYTGAKSDLSVSQMADAMTDTASINVDTGLAVLDGTAGVIGYATSANGTTWTVGDPEVLTGNGALWDSVGDPCVVKTSTNNYYMWYTGGRTNPVKATVLAVWNELLTFNLADIWTALAAQDVGDILTAIIALDLSGIKGALVNTGTDIGYASSSDGVTWAVQSATDLVGSTGGTWSSVAAPTVVESSGSYEMWFTEGISDLTVGKLADIYIGSDLPIGRATATPPAPPPPPPYVPPTPPDDDDDDEEEVVEEIPGATYLTGSVAEGGLFLTEVTAPAEDGQSWVTVPEGTTGLTAEGEPLTYISATEMEVPPPPPPDHSMIALTYTFGPEGATFDQPVGITLTYSEAGLPEGFDEESFVIVVWDEIAGEWIELETVVDTVNNTVTTYVTHFSTFSVLAATAPASFQISRLTVMPDEVEIDEDVTISILVENSGDLSGSYILELTVNNEVTETKEVHLAGHESVTASFTITAESDGVFPISINGLTGRFTVTAPPVIEAPKPADIFTSNLSVTPSKVETGDTVTISVRVANRGGQEGTHIVELKIDGVAVETERVTLTAGASQTVTFTTSQNMAAIYQVDIDGLSASFTVEKPETPEPPGTNWGAIIGGIIGGVAVIAVIVVLVLRRRGYLIGGA
jgi:hypothetical protein